MRALVFLSLLLMAGLVRAQPVWNANLDSKVISYETSDFGILVAGTSKSIFGIDGKTGQIIWRRSHRGFNESSINQVPASDLILITSDLGNKSRLETVDLLTGKTIWRSDKVKGDVLQLAVEPERDLIAVVIVKNPSGRFGRELRRRPVTHVLRLSDGEELWKRKFVNDVELMPSRFDRNGTVSFTLDNYRPPMILDGRLFMFYEGITSYDARTGKSREREKFGINENGLALTDADPVYDESYVYLSGRGKVRAVERRTGNVVWKAADLGVTPEMAVVGNVLYVRTGGQFTRIRDGGIRRKGPYGIAAIDRRSGKRLWRYKAAEKGITNFVFADRNTILMADKDDLISINANTGKRIRKGKHKVEDASFVLINERLEAVVGGRDILSAFRVTDFVSKKGKLRAAWSVKHKAPSRGVFRIFTGIALRATALYFRYGGLAAGPANAFRDIGFARGALPFRWSGLKTRFSSFDLTTLASNYGKRVVGNHIRLFGIAAHDPNFVSSIRGLRLIVPRRSIVRGRIIGGAARRVTPSPEDVRESLLARLDPVRRIEKLSDYFLRRKRLTVFRGSFMYFFTDLSKPFGGRGLVGVNVHTGRDARFILVRKPDERFTTDEINGYLYSANGIRLEAYDILER